MQPTTPAKVLPAIPGIPIPQPAPSGRPQVLQPLPPSAQQRTLHSSQNLQRSPSSRHIANQTSPLHGTSPTPPADVLCVIGGYTLTKQYIFRPDGTAMNGLMASHVTLVTYLQARRGQLITETELKGTIEVRAESTVNSYMHHLPTVFGIVSMDNEHGVKCWVMDAPKPVSRAASAPETVSQPTGTALDPGKRYYLLKATPSVLWAEGIAHKLGEHEYTALNALHGAGTNGVSSKTLAAAWKVEKEKVVSVLTHLRQYFKPNTILIERRTMAQGSLCRFQWRDAAVTVASAPDRTIPAAQPQAGKHADAAPVTPHSIRSYAFHLANQSNKAKRKIVDAEDPRAKKRARLGLGHADTTTQPQGALPDNQHVAGLLPSIALEPTALSPSTSTHPKMFFENPMKLDSEFHEFTLNTPDDGLELEGMEHALPRDPSSNEANSESRHEIDDFNLDDFLNPDHW